MYPEKGEIVIAKVKKIMPYGAFCILTEYGSEAFLPISQVSSGWVKNIHEFLSEGKQIVVKVVNVDERKGQVDVSLKQISEDEKKKKLLEIKRRKRGHNLLVVASKKAGMRIRNFEKYENKIEEKYEDLLELFETAFEEGESALENLDFPEKLKTAIVETAKANIKKRDVSVSSNLKIVCYGDSGVEDLKEILSKKAQDVEVFYLGAPNYKITASGKDYKEAEKRLSEFIEKLKKGAENKDCELEFKRTKH